MKRLAIFILSFFVSALSFASVQTAFQNYHAGNYLKASPALHYLAEKKNNKAVFYLATMAIHGYGVRKNSELGLSLMVRSGDLKYVPAQMYLGNYYLNVKKDLEKSFPWYKKAALAGNGSAQIYVGLAYLNGYGVKKNVDRARKFMIRAAKQRVPMAQYELAIIFLNSKYRSDKKMGRIWLRKSAEKNYTDAQFKLSMMLMTGQGMKKNEIEGMDWLKMAADKGNKKAQDELKRIYSGELKQEGLNNNEDLSTKPKAEPALAQWEQMMALLKKANVSLKNKDVVTADESEITKMPQLVKLSKSSIVNPNYSLVLPKDVPLHKIYSHMAKATYPDKGASLQLPHYFFSLPHGTQDYQQAQKVLAREASHGYVPAFYKLAQMYDKGLGVNKNEKKALEFYKKAAQANYLKAQYRLGLYYLEGKVVPLNYHLGITWLAKSAFNGSSKAQFVLGQLYEYGLNKKGDSKRLVRDVQRSRAMYTLAAQSGSAVAQYRLAQLYSSGLLNPDNNYAVEKKNLSIAYKLYQEAGKNGVEKANLALAYFYAAQVDSSEKHVEAFKIARKASADGNSNALMLLGVLYERGIGTLKDENEAMWIFRKLAEKNNSIAAFMLGTLHYESGKNKDKAVELLVKSASQGDVYAQYNLALLAKKNDYSALGEDFLSLLKKVVNNHYNKASILLADYYLMNSHQKNTIKQAANIYHQLAYKQDPTAQLKLGFMYERGILFKKNYKKAQEWYQKAAFNNNPVAQYLLGNMYLLGKGVKRDVDQALLYYKKSAAQHYVPAEVALGYVYDLDQHNYAEAKVWSMKAADADNAIAQYNLGLLYEYGKGIDRNLKKAFDFYQESAKKGNARAAFNVATMYLTGQGVMTNREKALHWYQQSAEKNNTAALYQLGLMSESGVGQPVDLNKAFSYYQQAAEQGNGNAQLALARMYEYGVGVSVDKNKAREHFRKAAQRNVLYAKWKLSQRSRLLTDSNYCIDEVSVKDPHTSFWSRITGGDSVPPKVSYMQALNGLNEGNIQTSLLGLKKIIEKDPRFKPAQRTVSHYFCHSGAVSKEKSQ